MEAPTLLGNLAHLYLAMAYGTDQELADAELGALIEKLHTHAPDMSADDVQEIVAGMLTDYLEHGEAIPPANETLSALRGQIPENQRRVVLEDLLFIAEADGVVLRAERRLLRTLANQWDLDLPRLPGPSLTLGEIEGSDWSVLHDLAFVYLVMAHDTDRELTTEEVETILQKLEDWQPQLRRSQVLLVLDEAVERYAEAPNPSLLESSIEAMQENLSRPHLLDVLEDLRQIANADGELLNSEKALIDHLRRAWIRKA